MSYSSKHSYLEKRRVDDALDLLRRALVEYLTALPRTSRTAYGSADLQALLKAFTDRFVEFLLPSRVKNLAFATKDARNEVAHYIAVMTPEDALRHLANIRQLLKDLGARSPSMTRIVSTRSNSTRCVHAEMLVRQAGLQRTRLASTARCYQLSAHSANKVPRTTLARVV